MIIIKMHDIAASTSNVVLRSWNPQEIMRTVCLHSFRKKMAPSKYQIRKTRDFQKKRISLFASVWHEKEKAGEGGRQKPE